MQILIQNIGKLTGILASDIKVLKGAQMNEVESIENAYLLVENGLITSFGHTLEKPTHIEEIIDADGAEVMPCFIDSHTHIVYAKSREKEFELKIAGKTYAEIAAAGGGILSSAATIKAITEDELFEISLARAWKLIKMGTGALEIKSGYGLDFANELKMLNVINRLKKELPISIKTTYLAAHALPKNFNGDSASYVNEVINKWLPKLNKLCNIDYIDAFCEKGFFSIADTQNIIDAGLKYGIKTKLHGNQLGNSGGALLAAKNNILSVDHLEYLNQEEMDELKTKDTLAVILPQCSYFLKMQYAPALEMLKNNLAIAIASDYNPGSSPSGNLWFAWSLACTQMGLTPQAAFNALTINAAAAVELSDKMGSISVGKYANFIFTKKQEHLSYYPYSFGEIHAKKVMIDGVFI